MKKLMALLLAVFLFLPTIPMLAETYDPAVVNLDGTMPIVKEGGKLETMTIINPTPENRVIPANELDQAVKIAEATGLSLDWVGILDAGYAEKVNLMLASRDLPDMFWKGIDSAVVTQYIGQDVFLPTDELIRQYAPNIQKILDENPEYAALTTYADGHRYGFPYIEEMFGLTLTNGPFVINQKWLDKLGLPMPTTPEEFKNTLIAFRDAGDLNENGEADEIPYAVNFLANDIFNSYNTFFNMMGCFGESVAYADPYAFCNVDENGKVYFAVTGEAFKNTLKYFRELQLEGLLDADGFSGDGNYLHKLRYDDAIFGAFGTWSPEGEIPIVDVRTQYTAIPRMTGENGKNGIRCNRSELWGTSQSVITVDAKYPELLTIMMNYLNEPFMAITTNWGTVGYSYIMDEETGLLSFDLDENGVFKIPEGFESWNDMRQNSSPVQGGVTILNEYYDTVAEYTYDAVALLDHQRANGKDEVLAENRYMPPILMTIEENATYTQIKPQVVNAVRAYLVGSILDGNIDENWDSYLASLESAGLTEMLNTIQSAYDRYLVTYNEIANK